MKAAQQEVKHCVKEAKDSYRRKVEQRLRDNNMREVWEGVKDHHRHHNTTLLLPHNLSLQIGRVRVPTLWKTSRIVPVPKKKNRPSELNDFRPVALTSHLMKTLERLFLSLLRPQVQHARPGSPAVRLPTSPLCFEDKLSRMGVDPQLMDWISDLPHWQTTHWRAPQGTVLAPLLFTLYTSDFCYNSELCHIQKYADDTAIVGCIRDDREEEYRRLVGDFAAWCHTNHLQLNTSKTKELVIDFGRSRPRPRPVLLEGAERAGRVEDSGQTAGYYGQCQPPSAHRHQQPEEPVQ
ncbi:hypothetical protein L3Q82_013574 [Scortum barcoo]|uniref:Uncharacterized protein n=1 Tax=Scortum barcoo TaxID=214431 RepID=A0ACB8W0A0_9TELE|nr:hypothetical protein L3Q82_013574 [Scortum barcoo]